MKTKTWDRAALTGGTSSGFIAAAMVALMVAALMGPFSAPGAAAPADPEDAGQPELAEEPNPGLMATAALERIKRADPGLFIVRLADDAIASYEGDRPGLARTRPDHARGQKIDADSPAVRAYQRHLERERERTLQRIERELGRSVEVDYVYDFVVNGFAAHFTPDEAAQVTAVRGVVDVEPEELLELQTDNGPSWIGADGVWGAEDPELATRGAGVIVGVIDTGINPSNPSFAGTGPVDGHVHENPLDGFVGVCDPDEPAFDETFECNTKLIGAWDFVTAQDSPANDARDVDSHGSHTASTAAGNVVDSVVIAPTDETLVIERRISGVAPHANIISYRGCGEVSCPNTATNAAINQAIIDGVDVINYSIGGGSTNPWTNSNALAFLDARNAGVFVATSAGNSGPGPQTAGSPGDAPWMLTVGSTTHDRNISNTLAGFSGGEEPFGDITGKGFTGPYGPAPILYAGDFGDALCTDENSFAPGTFNGEIVLCDRGGGIARVMKGMSVAAGGAGGMILANDVPNGATLNSDPHVLPAVHISYADGVALKAWLAEGTGHEVSITGVDGVDVDDSWADIMAAFSSRGPNAQIDIITPSVTAPGLDIIAAVGIGDPSPAQWGIVSGTSMSSPHAAGAGALLSALHPDWTPDQIQAALMTTAVTDGVLKEDAQTPADWFDMGAGRLDLVAASQAGLVLDETLSGYLAANPAEGGDPKALNLPHLANRQCLGECTWTRTVTATTDATWDVSVSGADGLQLSVSPASFSLTAGESQEVTITADVTGAESGPWLFGDVVFTSPDAPRAHFPVAVIGTGGVLPNLVEIDTRRDAGSQLVTGLQARPSPALTVDVHGLVLGTTHSDELTQDPNRGNPYEPLDAVWWTTFEVGADAARVVAEITATTAPDLDLFVGTGPTPSEATEVCSGTTPMSFEYCDIQDPAAGTWWVLVQNWQGSASQPDPFTLSLGVVPGADVGTMSVEAPATVGEGEVFDIRVFWHADMTAGDRWYGALTLGSEPASPGNIGRIPVDLVRHDDDVTKAADAAFAVSGDTVTYEITVEPNLADEDLTYTITDTIPDGMTYVEGSATGGATVTDGVLSWTGTMPTAVGAQGDYTVSTNATDPACVVPFGAGTWADFHALGFAPIAGFDGGDFLSGPLFTAGSPFRFYDQTYSGLNAAPVGTALFQPPFGEWWIPQALPDPAEPNAVVAGLWGDFQWVYDADAGTGFRALQTGTTESDWAILDHHGMERYGGSDASWSVQQWIRRTPASSGPSIVFAYHDLGSLNQTLTVGVEDHAGAHAEALVNAGPATGVIANDTIVCFTYEGPTFDPTVISYEVTVDFPPVLGTATNAVVHDTDMIGSQPAVASTDVEIVAGDVEVEAITVAPASARLRVGTTQQFTATAQLSDGSTADVTSAADWTSSAAGVVTVDGEGLATAIGGGRATVSATLDGRSGSAAVHVTGRPSQPGPPGRP